MGYFEALLAAEAHQAGRAQRSAILRHRHLSNRPLALMLWQLGAEPFTAAAVTWGFGPRERQIVVPGEPRDRELAFRALLDVAHAFNPWFERRDANAPPQIVVPNRGTLTVLGRLGRRLSYLPTEGEHAAHPALVRFGRHLRFLGEHARHPGQQLVVVLTDLLSTHWVTGLSELEAHNLPALDAAIAPASGLSAHEAAAVAERIEIGPVPTGDDDDRLDVLVSAFNEARGRRANGKPETDERVVAGLRAPIAAHYEALTDRGWSVLWRCVERERLFREAPSVARRWSADVDELTRHLGWVVDKGGRYRTRATSRQAAYRLRAWEDAQRLVVAEEAIDDPLRMIPGLLSGQALSGKVVALDLGHRELATKRMVARPRITIELDDSFVAIPTGKELFWTRDAGGRPYEVESVRTERETRLVTLKHTTGSNRERPSVGQDVVFSVHHTNHGIPLMLPDTPPWTHSGPPAPSEGGPIETDEGSWE